MSIQVMIVFCLPMPELLTQHQLATTCTSSTEGTELMETLILTCQSFQAQKKPTRTCRLGNHTSIDSFRVK